MNKPVGYEETITPGEFTPVEVGGHTAMIKGLEETTSSTGKPMVKVEIDFDSNDIQPAYFSNLFEADDRVDKKWPFNAVQYIVTEDSNGKCSKSFKSFVSSVEKSNNAECVWGPGFAKWFLGKKVGVIYGIVEEEYNGKVTSRRRIRYFCQYDKASGASVPDPKLLNINTSGGQPVLNEGFMNVPDGVQNSIPF